MKKPPLVCWDQRRLLRSTRDTRRSRQMMRPERLTDGYGSPRAVLGRPLVSRDFWGCASAGGSRQRVRSLRYAARPILGGKPLNDRDGVIRFPHRRKISSILIRNTVVPIAIRTTREGCLAIEGVKSPKTRSCYDYHPPGRSKTVRTAVGRQIFGRVPRAASP